MYIIDELECLGKNETIKRISWNDIRCGQVSNDRRLPVVRVDIQYIPLLNVSAVPIRVATIFNFEHAAMDVPPTLLKE
jgi:hypothetical protein